MRTLNGTRLSSVPAGTAALYKIAAEHGHTVDCFPLNRPALSIEDGGKCYIAMRPDLRGRDEREALAHELGHCEFGGFYCRTSPHDIRERHERRADKWAFLRLLPPAWVRLCIDHGICAVYRIAEEADVSAEFAGRALSYYHDIGLI